MEKLMAVSGDVKLPRQPPLRRPRAVKHHSNPVTEPHRRLIGCARHRLLPVPESRHLVHDWNQSRSAHTGKEDRPRRSELRRLERRRERGGDGGDAEQSDGAEVEVAVEGEAGEGVVDERVEGGDDEDGDAGVVEAEGEVAGEGRVAGEKVASAAAEEAEHGAD